MLLRDDTVRSAFSHACQLVQPSNRGEHEICEAIDLLIESGRTTDAIGLRGWRTGVGSSEDRDEVERRLRDEVEA